MTPTAKGVLEGTQPAAPPVCTAGRMPAFGGGWLSVVILPLTKAGAAVLPSASLPDRGGCVRKAAAPTGKE